MTAQQITKLIAARRALAAGATTQSTAQTTKAGQGVDKTALVRALSKETTAIRKIAQLALRSNAAALKAFAPAPKVVTAKRAKKSAGSATTGTTTGAGATSSNGTTAAAGASSTAN